MYLVKRYITNMFGSFVNGIS